MRLTHADVAVPEDWPLEASRLDVDLGGEGLLRIDYADGASAAFGLDPNHQQFPLEARRFSVHAECVARLPFGVPNHDARLVRARLVRLDEQPRRFRPPAQAGRRVRRGARRARGGRALADGGRGRDQAARLADGDIRVHRANGSGCRGAADLATAGRPRRRPTGARRRSAGIREGGGGAAREGVEHASRALSAERCAGADRARPHRSRLALAHGRNPAQGAADVPHGARL